MDESCIDESPDSKPQSRATNQVKDQNKKKNMEELRRKSMENFISSNNSNIKQKPNNSNVRGSKILPV